MAKEATVNKSSVMFYYKQRESCALKIDRLKIDETQPRLCAV